MFSTFRNEMAEACKQASSFGKPFIVDLGYNELNEAYLASFLDPIERQYHNCSCCRHFLRHYGGLIFIHETEVKTIWDFETSVEEYKHIPQLMRDIVLSKMIKHPFYTETRELGTHHNFKLIQGQDPIRWDHFYLDYANPLCYGGTIQSGRAISQHAVAKRALDTIPLEVVNNVLFMLKNNELSRGTTYLNMVEKFKEIKLKYDGGNDREQELLSWYYYSDIGSFRNTAIGTLMVDLDDPDLSKGDAIAKYSSKVSAINYQQTSKTPSINIISKAKEEFSNLGLMPSLDRRHMAITEFPIENALHVHNTQEALSDPFMEMKKEVPVKAEHIKNRSMEITLGRFLEEVLPKSKKIELLLEPSLQSNTASLLTADSASPMLWKWDNQVSWTYHNNLTDSIKERVKQAGGNVTGFWRNSLSWFNTDDLDIRIIEPDYHHIYFGNKGSKSKTSGCLDVDANFTSDQTTRTPVENIIYTDKSKLLNGTYTIIVTNYQKRETSDVGFIVEIEIEGKLYTFNHEKALLHKKCREVAEVICENGEIRVNPLIPLTENNVKRQTKLIGLNTNVFHTVQLVTNSPNYWKENIGNLHVFFLLEKAICDKPLRSIFIEYIRPDLLKYKAVIQELGNKLQVQPTEEQLTGVGFSVTQRNDFILRVDNSKIFKIIV